MTPIGKPETFQTSWVGDAIVANPGQACANAAQPPLSPRFCTPGTCMATTFENVTVLHDTKPTFTFSNPRLLLQAAPRLAALVPDYFYLLTQSSAECSTPTVGKRPPLPLRLALRTPQPLTRDFRCRFVDRIYKIDRIEKRELERCTPLATAYATRPAASWATQTHSRRRFAAARGRGES